MSDYAEEYSLGHALKLWQQSKEAKTVGRNFYKHLSIALRLFVLPDLDSKAKKLGVSDFDAFSAQIPLIQMKDTLSLFERNLTKAIQRGDIAQSTAKNYRSALKRFFQWMEKQIWWQCLFADSDLQTIPQRKKTPSRPQGTVERYPYSFPPDELPEHTCNEVKRFEEFRLSGGQNLRRTIRENRKNRGVGEARKPKIDPVKPSTFEKDLNSVLSFLGWYVEEKLLKEEYPEVLKQIQNFLIYSQNPSCLANQASKSLVVLEFTLAIALKDLLLSNLTLELLTEEELLDDYVCWAIETRHVSYSTGVNTAKTAIAIAKWLNYDVSVRRNWSDIDLINDLRDLRNEYAEEYAQEKERLDIEKWEKKGITHDQAREVVQYLRNLCAPYKSIRNPKTGKVTKSTKKRTLSAIARSWQTYLIVKILVYCPVRQEEVRDLVLGKTLFRREDEDGNPYYETYITEHKRVTRGKPRPKDRNYRLPSILTRDLDLWIYKWRPLIEKSVESLDGWMQFWGYSHDSLDKMRQKIEEARQGKLFGSVKSTAAEYIEKNEKRLKGMQRRVEAWEIAKQTLASNDRLFFVFGKHVTEAFGKPFEVDTLWIVVRRAFAIATQELFQEAKWTNPHLLRHIAEKHIRQLDKPDITEPFGTLIGHSKKMGDEYAEQITSEYELTEHIVDDWWLEEM